MPSYTGSIATGIRYKGDWTATFAGRQGFKGEGICLALGPALA
jgi:hypothetical protein